MRVAVLKSSTHRLLRLLLLVEVPLVEGTLVEEDMPVCIYMHTLMRDAEGKKKEASKVYVYMYICIYIHAHAQCNFSYAQAYMSIHM